LNFAFSEEQKQIRTLVRDFCEKEIDQKRMTELLRKNDAVQTIDEVRANYPWDLREKAHKLGLLTIGVPTKYGGPGPDTEPNMAIAVALEEAGYSGGLAQQGWFVVGPYFPSHGLRVDPNISEEDREKHFTGLVNSVALAAASTSEPDGSNDLFMPNDELGSDVMKVKARKEGNEWIINGDKMWSNNAALATKVTVAARTKEGPLSESMSNFLVPVDTPGVTRNLNKLIFMGFDGNCQFNYDNVRIPESALLGKLHRGYDQIAWWFGYKWIARCWGIGTAIRILEHMFEYAKQTVRGGRPLIQHLDTQARLGDLAMRVETMRAFYYKVAYETDQMEKYGKLQKPYGNWFWYATSLTYQKEVSWRITELAHDIYGSLAGSDDLPIEQFYRYNFMWRGAALTPQMALVRACKDYDIRYYHERM
jgi:alkylation response protein AidB-like acyl-CoA dehydrogenase